MKMMMLQRHKFCFVFCFYSLKLFVCVLFCFLYFLFSDDYLTNGLINKEICVSNFAKKKIRI